MTDSEEVVIEYLGFTEREAADVIQYYVCPICWGQLTIYDMPGSQPPLYAVACMEHGNVESIGRISNSSINIMMEQGKQRYKEVIRNVEYWKSLVKPPRTTSENIKALGF